MGFWKRLFGAFSGAKKVNVLVVGLDNSGKSTIINKLKPKRAEVSEVVPTVGFTVDEFKKNGCAFTVFDMSGAGRYRNLWERYYRDAQAVIFVVDTSDKLRMAVAKDELEMMLSSKAMSPVPVLFFANKQDLPSSLSAVETMQALGLSEIKDRPWQIVASNALTGEGLSAGIDWVSEFLKKK